MINEEGTAMYCKPGPGLIVRHPRTMAKVPDVGMWLDRTGPLGRYWRRRLACGDLVLCAPPEVTEAKKEAAKVDSAELTKGKKKEE